MLKIKQIKDLISVLNNKVDKNNINTDILLGISNSDVPSQNAVKQYVDNLIDLVSSNWVENVSELRANLHYTKTDVGVYSNSTLYQFDQNSNLLDNGTTVIKPDNTIGNGRWIKKLTINEGAGNTTLDLEYKTLVTPVISCNLIIKCNDGITDYIIPTYNNSIILDLGCKVNLSATFSYPDISDISEILPTSTNGDFGTLLPLPNINSQPYNNILIESDFELDQTLYREKTGLIITGEHVILATGLDEKNDIISIEFKSKCYSGNSTLTTLTESQIKNLTDKNFIDTINLTINSQTSDVNNYYYICYPSNLPDITNIIMDDYTSIMGSFTKIGTLDITNEALLIVNYNIYRSNSTGAFTNNKIKFI